MAIFLAALVNVKEKLGSFWGIFSPCNGKGKNCRRSSKTCYWSMARTYWFLPTSFMGAVPGNWQQRMQKQIAQWPTLGEVSSPTCSSALCKQLDTKGDSGSRQGKTRIKVGTRGCKDWAKGRDNASGNSKIEKFALDVVVFEVRRTS